MSQVTIVCEIYFCVKTISQIAGFMRIKCLVKQS